MSRENLYDNKMKNIGVVEGFFGPAWPVEQRESYASFLAECGAHFYIYAPKQDPHLRKAWREAWNESYLSKLSDLCRHFARHQIQFGVGLSPFALGKVLSENDKILLEEKLELLNQIGISMLGLFFDDMPSDDDLAETQMNALSLVRKVFKGKIIFCPTYYTYDPILEKVFGKMPGNYLQDIAANTPQDVSIAWTGPKVISPVIDETHLKEVTNLIKRKPFIWENLFANDGPKNCKFLKLKPFSGRDHLAFTQTEAFGLNMMNQAELSKYVFLASKYVLVEGIDPDLAFEKALTKLCSPELKIFILNHKQDFLEKGLDNITEDEKQSFVNELQGMKDKGAHEIKDWLQGQYIVGSECLTD